MLRGHCAHSPARTPPPPPCGEHAGLQIVREGVFDGVAENEVFLRYTHLLLAAGQCHLLIHQLALGASQHRAQLLHDVVLGRPGDSGAAARLEREGGRGRPGGGGTAAEGGCAGGDGGSDDALGEGEGGVHRVRGCAEATTTCGLPENSTGVRAWRSRWRGPFHSWNA